MGESEHERLDVRRAAEDPQIMRALYRAYHPRIFAYIAYRMGGRQDAEDVTSEVFMRMLRGLHTFEDRGEGAFTAWLFGIARNEVSRFYRRARPEPIPLEALPEIGTEAETPEGMLARKERFAALRRHIERLSPRRAEIIRLKFFGGLRNKEIALVLGLDERTVASHLSRALRDLQALYTNFDVLEVDDVKTPE